MRLFFVGFFGSMSSFLGMFIVVGYKPVELTLALVTVIFLVLACIGVHRMNLL